ncbi:MAG: ATP synthase F1 subunit epsilon [Opitutaceae bacterium]|nr:ATP synthase F1 subunit epsilon [Opitutaceae bacterium]|tara:strand:- start:160 stop:576 length:417 start_codon:yes stop_codon:yes gene_type:complete
MSIQLEIVTPESVVYSETVDSVVLPTASGEVGILPGHIPLISELKAGELAVTKEGALDLLAIDKGFAEVHADHVSVLTEAAIDIDDIDLESAEEAQRRAEEALKRAREEDDINPDEIEQLEAKVRFAMLQQIAKKKGK